jgi:hypothetical protein
MTVNLKINVQNGAVTITVGGQTFAPALSPAADQPAQLGAVKAQKALGPLPGGNPANASVEPGGNPANASVEPGGNPANGSVGPGGGPGSGAVVIGPIVLNGLSGLGFTQVGGNPANASVEPGGNPANASVEPGAAPPGSGLLVIGPIVIGGCAAKGGAVTPPVNVPLAAQPAAQ